MRKQMYTVSTNSSASHNGTNKNKNKDANKNKMKNKKEDVATVPMTFENLCQFVCTKNLCQFVPEIY